MDAIVQKTYQSKPDFYEPSRYQIDHESRLLEPLDRQLKTKGRLLDAFCGQGREAQIFSRAGYDVTGVDREPWMIEAARREAVRSGCRATFVVKDFDDFTCDRPFDVVYTSLWMYSTYQGRERRIAFLNQCRELCRPDGIIVVSTVGSTDQNPAGCLFRWVVSRLTGFLTRGNLRGEWGERFYSGLFWHHLSDDQVKSEVKSAGLRVEDHIDATGMDPVFYLLRSASPEPQSKAN